MDEPPPVPPDLLAELDALATALEQRPHPDVARKLEWLIDALVMRRQLPREYTARAKQLRADRSRVRLAPIAAPVEIDCAARLHLCQARCCSFELALSAQDVAAGLPFDLARPYLVPRDGKTGACACLGADRTCTIHDQRPAGCRSYDCRSDPRVWVDFEARIPAPSER
jgi:hypothetical protein